MSSGQLLCIKDIPNRRLQGLHGFSATSRLTVNDVILFELYSSIGGGGGGHSSSKGKGKGRDTCYSAAHMRLVTSSAFTISEVAADWHESMMPQRIMCSSSIGGAGGGSGSGSNCCCAELNDIS